MCVSKEREGERERKTETESAHSRFGAGGSMASSHGRSDLRFADWMASLPQGMHTIPLTNLAIPGRCFLTVHVLSLFFLNRK